MMRTLKIAFLAAGLGVAVPAMAKPAPIKKIATSCFEASLPGNYVPLKRNKYDPRRPYLGSWAFMSPNASEKVFIRCAPLKRGDFGKILDGNVARFLKKLAKWKQHSRDVTKDDGRNVGTVIGHGFMKAFDRAKKKSVAKAHVVARLFRRYHKTNTQVSITIAVTGDRSERVEQLLSLIGESFEPIDAKAKAKLKGTPSAIVKTNPTGLKGSATR